MTENVKTYLTISSASKQSGISKSVIQKATKTPVKDGGLACKNTPKGKGKNAKTNIDKTDFAVWEKDYWERRGQGKNAPKNDNSELKRTGENGQENAFKIKELEGELNLANKEIAQLNKFLEKAEQSEEDWKTQAQQLLIAHQPSQPATKNKVLRAILWGVGGFLFVALLAAAYLLLVERGVL